MYNAIVAKIHVQDIEGSKTLARGFLLGYSVAVDKSTEDGQLGLFFPCDGQLSEEFATANDLINRGTDENGNRLGGYFSADRRVKSQKFMKGEVISQGFFCPLNYLAFTKTDISKLKEGDEFNEINGIPICQKYITKATREAMDNARRMGTFIETVYNFPKHVDTKHYAKVGKKIPFNAVVYVTEKIHGTSGRLGNVPVTKKLSWFKKFLNRFGNFYDDTEYKHVLGTRNVITHIGENWRNEVGYRTSPFADIHLKRDEVIYYELFGYQGPNKPIMADHDVTKLNDKEMVKTYGKIMRYDYGLENGEVGVAVYRIVQNGIELSWDQVKARCRELGLDTPIDIDRFIGERETVEYTADCRTDGRSLYGNHIREGIVFRVESIDGITFVKNKSVDFGIMEGYLKNSDSYVDTEEAA